MKNKITENSDHKQTVLPLLPVQEKKVELHFTGEKTSSDGGVLLLKETENQIGIINSLVSCINDTRDQRYVTHSYSSMMKQRVFQICCGYEDANDCNELKNDAIFKICSDRLPQSQEDLSSQPTMSRFENTVGRSELYRMAKAILMQFIQSYEQEPEVVIIDCDDTNTNAYGQQLEIEFNNYYGEYCFMPLHIYEGLSGKLMTTILKPGRRSKGADVFAVLKRMIVMLREHWDNTVLIVRGDSHFCSQEFMDWAEGQYKVDFITGLTANARLKALSKVTAESAKHSWEKTGKPVKRYHSFSYKANSWAREQRVIVKVEWSAKGENIRYIVTNMWNRRAKQLYEIGYCQRGSAELRIKDHKTYLKSDRSSCNKFEANQLRLFMHSAAYILMHSFQKEVLQKTHLANATMKTLQLKLMKVAAFVKEMKTKIKIEFPRSLPLRGLHSDAFSMFEVLRC